MTANNADNQNLLRFTLRLRRNGAILQESHYQNAATGYSLLHTLYLTANATLNAGDVITLTFKAQEISPTGTIYLDNTEFSGFKIY